MLLNFLLSIGKHKNVYSSDIYSKGLSFLYIKLKEFDPHNTLLGNLWSKLHCENLGFFYECRA